MLLPAVPTAYVWFKFKLTNPVLSPMNPKVEFFHPQNCSMIWNISNGKFFLAESYSRTCVRWSISQLSHSRGPSCSGWRTSSLQPCTRFLWAHVSIVLYAKHWSFTIFPFPNLESQHRQLLWRTTAKGHKVNTAATVEIALTCSSGYQIDTSRLWIQDQDEV
jgi:hypothetical protein